MTAAPAHRLIAPAVLAELRNLELVARTVVDGTLLGLHRSPRFGFSQEFAEYRPYTPGDDLRFIDWNVFARTDRTYVKRYFGTTNAQLMLMIDASASMGIEPARGALPKLDYARFLAAAFGCLAARQHDAVGLLCFADSVRHYRPPSPRRRAVDGIYHLLDSLRADGGTEWERVLEYAAQRFRRRSLVVLVSDFLCPAERLLAPLRGLAARGHDLLLINVLDPAERQPVAEPAGALRDVETGRTMAVSMDDLVQDYPRRIARHLEALEQGVRALGGHFLSCTTAEPLDRVLAGYLRFRQRQP